jgi:hypothetical protein
MAKVFDITNASTTIPIDSRGNGQTSYSASNISGAPVRGRARLRSNDTDTLKWLALQGDVERDFGVAQTQQFTIKVAVPPDTPPGDHTFALQVVDVANPDELSDTGPEVSFKVLPTPPKPAPKLPWWWWIPVAAVGVIILIVVLVLVFKKKPAVTVTTNLPIIMDNEYQVPPGTNWGSWTYIGVYKDGFGNFPQFNVMYDLSSLPANATIQKAILNLYQREHGMPGTFTLRASKTTSSWDEVNPFGMPSCDPSISSTTPVADAFTWYQWDVTNILKNQRQSGVTNFGICVTSSNATYWAFFHSREDPANQPFVTVTYSYTP